MKCIIRVQYNTYVIFPIKPLRTCNFQLHNFNTFSLRISTYNLLISIYWSNITFSHGKPLKFNHKHICTPLDPLLLYQFRLFFKLQLHVIEKFYQSKKHLLIALQLIHIDMVTSEQIL